MGSPLDRMPVAGTERLITADAEGSFTLHASWWGLNMLGSCSSLLNPWKIERIGSLDVMPTVLTL